MNTLVYRAVCSTFQQVLQRVVEQLSPVREVMVVAVWLCADKRIISSYSGDFYDSKNKRFSWDLVLTFVCCGLRFWGWFLISVMLNVLHSFSDIRMIFHSILLMIGYVREIRHMYQFVVPTSEDFETQYCIKTVEDMQWVSLASRRKVWKTPLNVIMSLHVV